MKRIPSVIIAAIGAGLIGALVMLAGMSECLEHDLSFGRCVSEVKDDWELYLLVLVCAGIGGALCERLFGRSKGRTWANVGFAVLGAALSTLCGGVLAGIALDVVWDLPTDNVIGSAMFGAMFGFVIAFHTWIGVFFWVFGFTVLHLIMLKRRRLDELTTK